MGRLSSRQRPYADRAEAGAALAERLAEHLAGQPDLLVLGLPRGGIPVAAPVAHRLHAPLDVLLVRKVGLPGQPELAMGAVAAIGDRTAVVGNEAVLRRRGISQDEFAAACDAQLELLRQRAARYRGGRQPLRIAGRPVVVVDDGLATGATVRAAVDVLQKAGAGPLTVAVPIGAPDSCRKIASRVDALVCPWQPADFGSVSQGYRDFSQTSDADVVAILAVAG